MNFWPIELKFQLKVAKLRVVWDDGTENSISFRKLRAASPSAQNTYTRESDAPADITVLKAEHVGRYATRIHFSDGHDTGLFRWGLLQQLGTQDD